MPYAIFCHKFSQKNIYKAHLALFCAFTGTCADFYVTLKK